MLFEEVSLSKRRATRLAFESLEARVVPANTAPVITGPIGVVQDGANQSARLTVTATDDGGVQNLTYTWYVQPLSGFTFPTVTARGATATASGLHTGVQYRATVYVRDAAFATTGSSVTFTYTGPGDPLPTVVTPAAATLSADGTSARLSVLGGDNKGEANLRYLWTFTGPAGVASPTASPNYNNAAKVTTVRFGAAGTYEATATITDQAGGAATSKVTIIVPKVDRPLSVDRTSVTLNLGESFQFNAVYRDSFGTVARAPATATTWEVVSGGGAVTPGGLFRAPSSPGITVLKATADGATAFTTVVTRDPGTVPAKSSHSVGEQKVLVVQWVYADAPGTGDVPIDFPASVKQADQVDAFFRKQSFNKTGLNFTFVPVKVRLDHTAAYYRANHVSYSDESDEALRKAAATDPAFAAGGYDRVWFANHPVNLGSTGLGEVGGKTLWVDIRGGVGYAIHEFSHTYGLNHSFQDSDIGNYVSAPSRVRLGWETSSDAQGFRYQTVTAGGTYRLFDEASSVPATDGARALYIAVPGMRYTPGLGSGYTLSYSASNNNATVRIYEGEQDRLDTTPGSLAQGDWKDGGLEVGRTYALPNATADGKVIRVTVLGLTPAAGGKPAAMSVRVEFVDVGANRKPVATRDAVTTPMSTPVLVNVLANDTDADGDRLSIIDVVQTLRGTASISGNAILYTPNLRYTGTDTFTYTVSDGRGGTATATATVTIVKPPAALATPQPSLAAAETDLSGWEVHLNGVKLDAGRA